MEIKSGSLTSLIAKLKSEKGKDIYCDGGGEIVNELLRHDLIDEFRISVIPILLGGGRRLFHDGRPEMKLKFISTTQYETGLVQTYYKRLRISG